jgi:hypothetical protein
MWAICFAPRASDTRIPVETTITFEELLKYGQPAGVLPKDYAGLRWSEEAWFVTKQFIGGTAMGNHVGLMNAHGRDISVESDCPFDLVGLSLCALWADIISIDLEGWEKSAMKYAATIPVRKGAATAFSPGWENIDQVQIKANGRHFIVNNITVAFI